MVSLVLKTEEGNPAQGILEAEKGKKTDSPLQPPERNAAYCHLALSLERPGLDF